MLSFQINLITEIKRRNYVEWRVSYSRKMRILRFFVVVYDPEDAEHLKIYSIFTYLVIKSIQSAEKILLDIRLFILDILHKLILYLLVCNIIHICSFKP